MAEHPEPLTPADCDLRDFPFMPLDVVRLRDSDLAATPDGEVFRAAVLAWCVAWHQIPAASLPDDDAVLARLLGYGRDVKGWQKLRAAGSLRGFVKCSDGRLYHPVVAEKANEAWQKKVSYQSFIDSQSQKGRMGAAKRWNRPVPPENHSSGDNSGHNGDSQPYDQPQWPDDSLQGQGQGQGQKPPSSLRSDVPPNGRRWEPDEQVPPNWIFEGEQLRVQHGLAPVNLVLEAAKFANHWAGKSGRDATKRDWKRTWFNWVLRTENHGRNKGLSAHDKGTLGLAMFVAEAESHRAGDGGGTGAAGHRLSANGHGPAEVEIAGRNLLDGPSAPQPGRAAGRLPALSDEGRKPILSNAGAVARDGRA